MSSPETPSTHWPGRADDTVAALLEERARLQRWLARLDESAAGVPPHIAERVRSDYEARMRQVLNDLLPLLNVLRDRLAEVDRELHAAEKHWAQAADALEEARLRHLAGELDDEGWAARSPALHEAMDAADTERSRIRGEWDQLRSLIREIEGPSEPEAPAGPEQHAEGEQAPVAAADLGADAMPDPDAEEAFESALDEILFPPDGAAGDGPGGEVAIELDLEQAEDLPWVELLDAEAPLDADDASDAARIQSWIGDDGHPTDSAIEAEERDHVSFLEELDRTTALAPTGPFANPGMPPGGWMQPGMPIGGWAQPGMVMPGMGPFPIGLPAFEPGAAKPAQPVVSSDQDVGCVRCGGPCASGEWYCESCSEESG